MLLLRSLFMKRLSILFFLTLFFLVFTTSVEAKTLPQASKSAKTTVSKTSTSTSIGVSVKLRADRRAVVVYFSNLKNAKSVAYMLTYKTNTQDEGAMGGINISGKSNTSQEILFGTCSKGVCRYHVGVRDVKLEVSYTSINGKKYLKKYKIKI